ncbi:MAG: EF-hand domain-containing protein [Rhodocyclales bacterium]|nr:EF-hand domain-containing protein [Rhodocyclales bacterium]
MSSIGAVGNSGLMMHGMGGRPRPNPAEMADKLFGALDTGNQGYIEQSDLESALGKIGTGDTGAAELFAQLDGNSDGKVSKDEFSSALQAAAAQLDAQFGEMRMQGGMPPPPPPGDDAGFTKDELENQLSEIGASDSKRASLISEIVDNFDAADADGDGKVSFKEAMAYDQGQDSTGTRSATDDGAGRVAAGEDSNLKLMLQVMRLVQAYDLDDNSGAAISTAA